MTPCERKCWDCGNVAMHEDNVTPHVLCKKCGSQDTRLTDKTTFFLTQMADLLRENTKGIEDSINELGEIRATLIVNFGAVNGRGQSGIRVNENRPTLTIMMDILDQLVNQPRPPKPDTA